MLNILLAAYLLIVMPGLNLWRSLRPRRDQPPRPRLRTYWALAWPVVLMLAVLLGGARQAGYTAQALGFDLPLSRAGGWGLGFALLLLAGLQIADFLMRRRKTPQALAERERALLDTAFPWPHTRAEIVAFCASMTLMTAAWEVLYRGFLLLLLAPRTGLPVATALAALAYGVGHGYKNPRQLIASIVAALVFTIAYAATHSLWWLMLIHAGLPVLSIPAVLRARRRRAAAGAADPQSTRPAAGRAATY